MNGLKELMSRAIGLQKAGNADQALKLLQAAGQLDNPPLNFYLFLFLCHRDLQKLYPGLEALALELKYFPENVTAKKFFEDLMPKCFACPEQITVLHKFSNILPAGGIMIDVGSGLGHVSASQLHEGRSVIGLEPVSGTFDIQTIRFRNRLKDGTLNLFPEACSNEEEQRYFACSNDIFSLYGTLSESFPGDFEGFYPLNRRIHVQTTRLSSILRSCTNTRTQCHLVKIDVSGHELEILQGCFSTGDLQYLPAGLMISFVPWTNALLKIKESLELLIQSGYTRFKFVTYWARLSIKETEWLRPQDASAEELELCTGSVQEFPTNCQLPIF